MKTTACEKHTFFVLWFSFILSVSSILLSPLFFAGEAHGDEFKLIPSFSVGEQYNDNLFFTPKDKTDDFITTTSAGLELSDRTERLDLDLLGRFNWLKYAKNNDLSGVEQDYRGRLGYSVDPRLKFWVQGEYKSDISPGENIEVTGLVLSPIRRDWQNYSGGMEYNLSEKTKANLSYSYEQAHFDDPRLVDYQAHDANLGFTHDLSQYFLNTSGRINFEYDRYEFQSTAVDYYSATIGMNRALNEKWTLTMDGGGSYIRSRFEAVTTEFIPPISLVMVGEQERQEGWGWVGMATLSYNGEKTTGNLTFSHRVSPAYGSVGVAERTSLTFDITRRFTYELSGRLSGGFYLNKAEQGQFSATAGIDQVMLRINPGIRYEFTKDIALEASYSYDWLKDRLAQTEAKRNLFMINVTIQHSFFE